MADQMTPRFSILLGTMLWNAAGWGLPASALCITRHLANVASPNYTPTGLNDKRKRFWFEIGMCVVMPFVFAAIRKLLFSVRFSFLRAEKSLVDRLHSPGSSI